MLLLSGDTSHPLVWPSAGRGGRIGWVELPSSAIFQNAFFPLVEYRIATRSRLSRVQHATALDPTVMVGISMRCQPRDAMFSIHNSSSPVRLLPTIIRVPSGETAG